MKENKNLPDWCRILDGLNSEIAEERGRDPEELKQTLLRKIREPGAASSQHNDKAREHHGVIANE